MKISRLRSHLFSLATLLAVLAVPTATPAVAAEKARSSSDRFELSWTRVPSPELKFALEHLESVEKRFQSGNAPKEEILGIRQQIDALERRAGYSITIRSNGGSLREFVAATSGSDEVSFTLINAGEPSDLETPIPAFTLRNSNWGTVVNVLGNFLATRGLMLTIAGSDNPNPSESKSVVCVLRRDRSWAPPSENAHQPEFETLGLADVLTEKLKIDDVVDAIQMAWQFEPERRHTKLRFQFHPATKILLVSGPEPAAKIARQIVASLQKNPVAR